MQANYSTEAKEKYSSTSKGGRTNVDVIVQTVQLDKNDDECIEVRRVSWDGSTRREFYVGKSYGF